LLPGGSQELTPQDRQDARSQEEAEKAARLWHRWHVAGDLAAAARGAAESPWILQRRSVPIGTRTPAGVLAPALEAAAGDQLRQLAEVQRRRQQVGETGDVTLLQALDAQAGQLTKLRDGAIARLVAAVRERLPGLEAADEERRLKDREDKARQRLLDTKKRRGLPLGPPAKRCKGAIDSQARAGHATPPKLTHPAAPAARRRHPSLRHCSQRRCALLLNSI
jgi:hypothetical protein